jgi:putative hydrolase of the HAD superfamily
MIKNIIFDVGNVFVQWSPQEIVERCFDLPKGSEDNMRRAEALFRGPVWLSLNRGERTQKVWLLRGTD